MLLIIEKDQGFASKLKNRVTVTGLKTMVVESVADAMFLLDSMKAGLVLANLASFNSPVEIDTVLAPTAHSSSYPSTQETSSNGSSSCAPETTPSLERASAPKDMRSKSCANSAKAQWVPSTKATKQPSTARLP